MAHVQVHTWEPNSNSGKPMFALAEKGVPYDYQYVSLPDFEQHSPEYLAINPAGTVPTLVHGGEILTESTPMCEYVDNAFEGPALVPTDPKARYWMRWWGRQVDINAAALSVLGWHNFLGPMARKKSPEELEALIARIPTKERRIAWSTATKATFTDEQLGNAKAQLGEWIATLDKRLAVSPYLVGEDLTVADIVAFANFYALPMTVPEHANKANAPHYIAWLRRMYARPAVMETFGKSRSLARRAFDIAAQLEEDGE